MSYVLELSRFRVLDESEDAFAAAYPACLRALEGFEGFRGASLAKMDDASFVFVAEWAAREHCEAAMAKAMDLAPITAFLAHISEEISMEFGDLVDAEGEVAAAA